MVRGFASYLVPRRGLSSAFQNTKSSANAVTDYRRENGLFNGYSLPVSFHYFCKHNYTIPDLGVGNFDYLALVKGVGKATVQFVRKLFVCNVWLSGIER